MDIKTTLIGREFEIINRIENGDKNTLLALDLVKFYFSLADLQDNTTHVSFIDSIYIKRDRKLKWLVASENFIGERTSFRYRNQYVNLIEFFSENPNKLKDVFKQFETLFNQKI